MIARLLLALLLLVATGSHPVRSAEARPNASAIAPAKPWLGVAFAAAPQGVRIEEVIPDSPADLAGILVGDVVQVVGGIATPTIDALLAAVGKHSIGDDVVVQLRRRGRPMKTTAELTQFLKPDELLRRRLVDKVAPAFSLDIIHGRATGDSSKLLGKVVVVEFWSNWCKVCRETIEPLANLQAENLGDVEVLIITAEHESQTKRYLSSHSMPIPILHDQQGRVHQSYHVDGIVPTIVVIGRDGLVRYADNGNDLNMDSALLLAKRALRERSL
ncbi:MAG: redoxin domain-containing protein [Myxococcales bacterium]|nr:redoxin domain-containing protein [Myxococcales bacterium]